MIFKFFIRCSVFVCFALLVGLRVYPQSLFDDIETITENNPELSYRPNSKVIIQSLVVLIDGKSYVNPVVGQGQEGRYGHRVALVMRYLSLKKDDVLRLRRLQTKINLSQARLAATAYFSDSEVNLSYTVEDAQPYLRVTLYVSVKASYGYQYGGNLIYGYFGLSRLNGFKGDFYPGLTFQGVDIQGRGFAPYSNGSKFRHFMFDVRWRFLNYWLWSSVLENVNFDSFIYGTDFDISFVLYPGVILEQTVGVFGHSTTDIRSHPESEVLYTGSPTNSKTGLTLLFGTTFLYSNFFKDDGFFRNYIKLKVPYFYGFSNRQAEDELTWFDFIGYELDTQMSLRTGVVHHGFYLKSNFISPLLNNTGYRSLITKANLDKNIFSETALRFGLRNRGVYPTSITVGDYGYSVNTEYRIGFFQTGLVGLGLYFFYDVGGVGNSIDLLSENTRHTVGPGVSVRFFEPVGLLIKFDVGIGGELLGNLDGNNLTFNISVTSR